MFAVRPHVTPWDTITQFVFTLYLASSNVNSLSQDEQFSLPSSPTAEALVAGGDSNLTSLTGTRLGNREVEMGMYRAGPRKARRSKGWG